MKTHADNWFYRSVLLAVIGAAIAWTYFIVAVPSPGDVISQQQARDSRQWRELSILKTKQASQYQEFIDFEQEMRRMVNPREWITDAMIRRDIAELKQQIVDLTARLEGERFGRRNLIEQER